MKCNVINCMHLQTATSQDVAFQVSIWKKNFCLWKTARLPFLLKRTIFKFWVLLKWIVSHQLFWHFFAMASKKERPEKIIQFFILHLHCITVKHQNLFSIFCKHLLWLSKNIAENCAWIIMLQKVQRKRIIEWIWKNHRNIFFRPKFFQKVLL